MGNLRSRGTVMLRLWRLWLLPSTNLMRKVLRTYLSKLKTSSNPCWRKIAGVWKPHTESQYVPCGGTVSVLGEYWESVWACACVIHTDNFFLVPYSLQLIMSHSEQNIPCDICSQFAYQIAYLSILKPGIWLFFLNAVRTIPCMQQPLCLLSAHGFPDAGCHVQRPFSIPGWSLSHPWLANLPSPWTKTRWDAF